MSGETEQATAWTPRLIPGEEILSSFEGDNPAGEELTYSGLYEQLKETIRADDPEVMGGDAFKPKGGWKVADWGEASTIARDTLVDRSKDLRVASYLARALAEQNGLTGMREGLWLMRELQERFWDHLHPLPDKTRDREGNKILDPVPRVQDLTVVFEHYAALLRNMEIPEGDIEDTLIVKVLKRVTGLEEELERLDAFMDQRYLGRGPSLSILHEPLNKYAKVFRKAEKEREEALREAAEAEERERREAEARAEEEARRAEEEASRREAEAEARRQELASLGFDPENPPIDPGGVPRDRNDVLARLAVISGWLQQNEPGDPAAYRLLLSAVWSDAVPGTPGPPPPDTARQVLEKVAAENDRDQIMEVCRAMLVQEWGRNWIDPVCVMANSLAQMADAGAEALRGIEEEVRFRAARDQGFLDAVFADGSPAAGEATIEWAAGILSSGREGDGAEVGGIPQETLEKAGEMFDTGDPPGAIDLLNGIVSSGQGERSKALMRLDLAEFCAERGLPQVADAIFRDLASMVEQRKLERWETPAFLARVYEGIYNLGKSGEEGSEGSQELVRHAFEKLCLTDPGRALRNR